MVPGQVDHPRALPIQHLHAYQNPGHVLPPAAAPVQVPGQIQYLYPPGGVAAAATPNEDIRLPQPFANGPHSPFSPAPQIKRGGLSLDSRASADPGRSQIARWKECKISGQIGSPGQKDKLTYTGLSFQIVSARQRGFSDADICAAVIKAIVPGEDLRTYLEMCPELNLETMIPILRAHFKETDATAVFTELSNGTQQPSESENDFCLRMMALRQKVLLMSDEEKGQYSRDLVQDQFQKSLGTGFRREAVRQQLRATLKAPIDDVQLLREVGEVVMTELEHNVKVKNRVAANKVLVEEKEKEKAKTTTTKQGNPLMGEISKLTAQINQLTGLHGEVEKLRQELENRGAAGVGAGGTGNGQQNGGGTGAPGGGQGGFGRGGYRGGRGRGRGRFIGCPTCRQNGRFCRHCFGCGSEDHEHADCTVNPKNGTGDQC